MAQILLPQRFMAQPQYPAPLDYGGLAKGVKILFNPPSGPVDLATNRAWTANGNASVATANKGKVLSFDGVGDYLSYTGYPELTSNVGTFFIWCPVVGPTDDFGHVLLGSASPGAVAFQVSQVNTVQVFGSGLSSGTISWFNSTNRSLVLSSGGTAATCKAYLDGANTGLTFPGAPVAWGAGNKTITLGRYPAGDSWDFNGTILVAGFTTAAWGESEARAFHQNPWALFKAPSRRLFVASSAPSGDSAGSASGSATVSGVGASVASASGLSSGAATVSGVGSFSSEGGGAGSSSGVATVLGVGASIAASTGSASGSASVSGVGSSVAAGSAVGSSSGSATVSGVGASIAASRGIADGGAVVTGKSPVVASAQGETFSGGYPVIDHEKRKRKKRLEMGIIEDDGRLDKTNKNKEIVKKKAVSGTTEKDDSLARQEAINAELKRLMQIELEREEEEIVRLLMEFA